MQRSRRDRRNRANLGALVAAERSNIEGEPDATYVQLANTDRGWHSHNILIIHKKNVGKLECSLPWRGRVARRSAAKAGGVG